MGNSAAGAVLGDAGGGDSSEAPAAASGQRTFEIELFSRLGLQLTLHSEAYGEQGCVVQLPSSIDATAVLRVAGPRLEGHVVYECLVAHGKAVPQEKVYPAGKAGKAGQPGRFQRIAARAVDLRGSQSRQLLAIATKEEVGYFGSFTLLVGAVYGAYALPSLAVEEALAAASAGEEERGLCSWRPLPCEGAGAPDARVALEVRKTGAAVLAQRSSLLDALERRQAGAAAKATASPSPPPSSTKAAAPPASPAAAGSEEAAARPTSPSAAAVPRAEGDEEVEASRLHALEAQLAEAAEKAAGAREAAAAAEELAAESAERARREGRRRLEASEASGARARALEQELLEAAAQATQAEEAAAAAEQLAEERAAQASEASITRTQALEEQLVLAREQAAEAKAAAAGTEHLAAQRAADATAVGEERMKASEASSTRAQALEEELLLAREQALEAKAAAAATEQLAAERAVEAAAAGQERLKASEASDARARALEERLEEAAAQAAEAKAAAAAAELLAAERSAKASAASREHLKASSAKVVSLQERLAAQGRCAAGEASEAVFVDCPAGAGLLDRCCPGRATAHQRRQAEAATQARAAAQWCCGGAGPEPESALLPPLWMEQAIASLRRLDCAAVMLGPCEQVPLWRPTLGATLVVSDNADWCLVPGLRVVLFSGFDMDGDLWPSVAGVNVQERLTVRYTSTEVLHQSLSLHLPAEADGGARPRVPQRGPWNPDHAVWELALLCGTEATKRGLKKHKVYDKLHLSLGAEPVEQLGKWLRSRLFPVKAWRKDVRLETLEPIFAGLVKDDKEFSFEVRFARLVFTRDVPGLQALRRDWASHLGLPGVQALPQGPSAAPGELTGPPRAVALGASDVYLEPFVEEGHSSWAYVSDLRRLAYSCMTPQAMEHYPGGTSTTTVKLEQSLQGSLEALWATWSSESRLRAFTRCVEHNLLKLQGNKGSVEGVVWADVETCKMEPGGGYLRLLFAYLLSTNLRPDGPRIMPHEFDALLCAVVLSAGTGEQLSPLAKCPPKVTKRLAEVRAQAERLALRALQPPAGLAAPPRAARLAAVFQATAQALADLARVLGLDRPTDPPADGQKKKATPDPPPLQILEPKAIFNSGLLFLAFFCAGAYEEGELEVPAESKKALDELCSLRLELLQCARDHGDWVGRLAALMPEGMLKFPAESQQREAKAKSQQREELPIDAHRESILKHIASNRVTCVHGAPGCGKSVRVPLYLLEAEGERRAGVPVRILSVQPRQLACAGLARHVARCLGEEVGETVGYKVLGESVVSERTKITFVATRCLLQELVHEPSAIDGYSHVLLDEAHERSLEADLVHLMLKMRFSFKKFRLVVMSATLQASLFTRYFVAAAGKPGPPERAGGRRHRVEVVHLEDILERFGGDRPLGKEAAAAIAEAEKAFNSGFSQQEIIKLAKAAELRKANSRPLDEVVDPEFADSSGGESEPEVPVANGLGKAGGKAQEQPAALPAALLPGLERVAEELVRRLAKGGEAIIIFLPDLAAVMHVAEALAPLEQEGLVRTLLFHALAPREEREEVVAGAAEESVCRVVLATEAAESSLTVAGARVVIDFGLRRHLAHDAGRQLAVPATVWSSKAASKQRAGRVGRLCPGLCIRLFTKAFHDSAMPAYDLPEVLTMPPERLCLEVKNIASRMPPSPSGKYWSPAELLRMMLSPPDAKRTLACAERLDELGAFTGTGEDAELTALGCLMSALPLDGRLCRLVLFGCLFGAPCDALVMAAGLAVQDPFGAPDGRHVTAGYIKALRQSASARWRCDAGHLSEPLMLRTLFIMWLRGLHAQLSEAPGPQRRALLRPGYACQARALAGRLAASAAGLVRLAALAAEIALRLKPFLPSGCEALLRVDALLVLLRDPQDSSLPLLEDVFCQDPWQLKALLACAFAPQFLAGEVQLQDGRKGPLEEMLGELLQEGFDPSHSVVLTLDGARSQDTTVLDGLKRALEGATGGSVRLTGAEGGRVFVGLNEDGAAVEVPDEREAVLLEAEEDLPRPLPDAVGVLDGLGAGREHFALPLPAAGGAKAVAAEVTVHRPTSPFAVAWEVLPAVGSEGGKRAARQQKLRASCNWRNALGALASCCAADEDPPWGQGRLPRPAVPRVLAVYASAAVGPAATGSNGSASAPVANVSGVTLLSAEADGRVSLALALAFLRQQHDLELDISEETGSVEAVRLFGTTEIKLRERGAQEILLLEDVEKVNDVRRALSAAFRGGSSLGLRGRRSSGSLSSAALLQSAGDEAGLATVLGESPQLGGRDSDAVTEALLALRLALRVPRPEEGPPSSKSLSRMRLRRPPGADFRLFWPIGAQAEGPSPPEEPPPPEVMGVDAEGETLGEGVDDDGKAEEDWAEEEAAEGPPAKRPRLEEPEAEEDEGGEEPAEEGFADGIEAPQEDQQLQYPAEEEPMEDWTEQDGTAAEGREGEADDGWAEEGMEEDLAAEDAAGELGEQAQDEDMVDAGDDAAADEEEWAAEEGEAEEPDAGEDQHQPARQQEDQQEPEQQHGWEWEAEGGWAEEQQAEAAAEHAAGRHPRGNILSPTAKSSASAAAGRSTARHVPPRINRATGVAVAPPVRPPPRGGGGASDGRGAIGAVRARRNYW